MSYAIDIKYWLLVKHKCENLIEGEKVKLPTLAQFKCPVCGGSKSNPKERTGGIFRGRDNQIHFQCLREKCKSQGFGKLMKVLNVQLAREYYEKKYNWKSKRTDILLEHDKRQGRDSTIVEE
jgi:hypothetical protein